MRKGNLKTKLLSMLLVVVMIFTSISVWPTQEEVKAASNYTELTFSDFGMDDGVYGVGNMKRNTTLTSLDGVAIIGDLVFIGDGDHRGLSLEAGNSGWTTFQIYRVGTTVYLRHWGATGMPEVHFDASELGITDFTTTKIRTRICFDKGSDTAVTATMTMTVGDKSVTKTLAMEGVADMVYSANGYRIGTGEDGSASVGFYSVQKETRVYTFSDFGITEGNYAGSYAHGTLPEGVTSWDGMSLVGEIIIPKNDDGAYIGIAGTQEKVSGIKLFGANGNQLWFWNDLTGQNHLGITEGQTDENGNVLGTVQGEKLKVRFDFALVDNDVQMQFTVNDTWVYNWTFGSTASALGNRLVVSGNVSVYDATEEEPIVPDEPGENENTYTFSDFGITEGNYAGTYAHGTLPEGVTSWDGMSLIGEIVIPKNDDGAYIGIAGTQEKVSGIKLFGANGNQLWFWNDLTGQNHLGITEGQTDENGNVLGTVQGEKLKVRFDFALVDNDVQMQFTVNDTWVYNWTFGSTASALGNRLVVSGNVSVYDATEEEPIVPDEPGENENTYTFSDFGITEGNYAGTYAHGTLPEGVTSWDGMSLVGEIVIPKNDDGAYIGIAGTQEKVSGIKLFGANGNQLWFWNDLTGQNHLGITEGQTDENGNVLGTVQGEKLKVRFDFALVDNDVQMQFTVNDTWVYNWTFGSTASALGNRLVISGNVTVADVKAETEEPDVPVVPDEPEEVVYTELTFSDFGWEDNTYTSPIWKENTELTTLDQVALTGDITFGCNGAHTGLRIDPMNDDWVNFQIYRVDNLLVVAHTGAPYQDETTGQNATYISASDLQVENLSTTEIRMTLCFDKESDTALKVTITMSVGDVTVTRTGVISDVADLVASSDGYRIGAAGSVGAPGLTIASVGSETEEPDEPIVPDEPDEPIVPDVPEEVIYTELTFEDLGIKDATYSGGYATGTLPDGITSFDEVAITGVVTLPKDSDSPYIGFAGTKDMPSGIKMFGAYGNSLWMWNDLTGKNHLGVHEGDLDANGNVLGTLLGEPLKIWVGFNFVDNDVHMTIVLDEVWTHNWIIEDSAEALGTNVTVSGDVTIGEPKVYEYTEVSFDDFGLVGQQLTGETAHSNKKPAESMDLLKFVGYITFPDGRDNGHISIAGEDGNNGIAVFWQSDNIWFWDETGASMGCIDAFKPEEFGYESFAGKELKVAIAFAYDESDVFITMTIDDSAEKTKLLTGYAEWLGTEIKCVAGNEGTITYRSSLGEAIKKPVINETPVKELSKYETVTFIEMGIEDETVKGFGREDKNKIDTLDGKVFQGFVTFPADGQGIIRIGGTTGNKWYGVHVESSNGGLRLYEAANGKQNWNISSDIIGKDITDKHIKLALTFTKVDDHNVYVGVYVDDVFCGEKLFENLEQAFGSGLLVYSEETGISIASIETAWQKFLKSKVNLAYFGFTDNWKQELADICR